MKHVIFLRLAFFAASLASLRLPAQPLPVDLLGNWQDDALVTVPWLDGRYNEVWGIAVNGREFAVLGSTAGMHFIDVTDPTDPQEVALVPGSSAGPIVAHRDFKEFGGYLYCVADEGSAAKLQVIDIQNLPDGVNQVYASNDFVTTAHNLFIDTSAARLYLVGAQNKTVVLDISDPTAPGLLAFFPNFGFSLPYVHDAHIDNHIGFMNCGSDGLWVVDFSNPNSPVLLGTMTNYPGAGYNHSGWPTADGNHYILCDETHGSPVKVVDIQDFSDMNVVATMDAGSAAPTQIPHNALVRENLLFVSYYYDGLQVYDITNPLVPQRIAFYDTYDGPDANFYAGAWGVYPYLPSGNILVSDIQTGLWVFAPVIAPPNLQLVPETSALAACVGEELSFGLTIGSGFLPTGVLLSVEGTDLPFTAVLPADPVPPGTAVTLTLTDLASTGFLPQSFLLKADDGQQVGTVGMTLLVGQVPDPPDLLSPADQAQDVPLLPQLDWAPVPFAQAYKLQIATDPTDFSASFAFGAVTADDAFTLSAPLAPDREYYWRIVAQNTCGTDTSGVFAFRTEAANAVGTIGGGSEGGLFPNPVRSGEPLQVRLPAGLSGRLTATLCNSAGQPCWRQELLPTAGLLSVQLPALPAGHYRWSLSDAEGPVSVESLVIIR